MPTEPTGSGHAALPYPPRRGFPLAPSCRHPTGVGTAADILAIETHLEYLSHSRAKYRTHRPTAGAAKRSPGNILLGLMCSTGLLMLLSALPVGVVLTLSTRYGARAGQAETALVGGLMSAATTILGGALLGLGMFITSRRWRKRGSA